MAHSLLKLPKNHRNRLRRVGVGRGGWSLLIEILKWDLIYIYIYRWIVVKFKESCFLLGSHSSDSLSLSKL
uniref:Uncharacterized protein n=1 Tax=Rhizophora mucronata TaxID=61149 RepID=A0A2P2IVB1_RHIMU